MSFLVHLAIVAASLWIAAYLIPGVRVGSVSALLIAALVLGLVNALVRPILTILTLPITIVTLGLFYLVVNGVAFALAASIVPGFEIAGFGERHPGRAPGEPRQLGAWRRPRAASLMLSALFRTLGLGADAARTQETETVSRIATVLTGVTPERARLLAAFAYLLGRVAFADHDVSADERAVMEARLATEADVSPEQAEHLVQLAVAATGSHGAAEDYQVAREFEVLATREEKLQLLRALFTVSAQQGIATVEDTEISRIASALRLDRTDVTALRHEFRDAINARQPKR